MSTMNPLTSHQTASEASTTAGLPMDTSLDATLRAGKVRRHDVLLDARDLRICAMAVGLAIAAAFVARALTSLIGLVTHLAYYGQFSLEAVSPAENHLGPWAVLVPCVGGLVVGLMARYGSKAIRGHGIPEAMEQILFNDSRIPARITFLKPASAAISIGTGGPFGAEGPIIATGGALGSVLGQLLETTSSERKTLLASGAAAGMTAIFGSPISAVLLAIELLLFEFRPRSFVPVALAATTAMGARALIEGTAPAFAMPELAQPGSLALMAYVAEGALLGVLSVGVTRLVYGIEDAFEKLPIHWMYWPMLGGLAVGLCGQISPRTLGVGYDNIEGILAGSFAPQALAVFCAMKFVSWSIALGSGTSGGTLAPLLTIGGGAGALLGMGAAWLAPAAGIDPRAAALVGMAAMFTGASRALLASVLFAFEATRQPLGLVPLLGGCTASFVVSAFLMRHTIMTEKIARRGRNVPVEYIADPLHQARVEEFCTREVVCLGADDALSRVRELLTGGEPRYQHQGFPVLGQGGELLGVVTRRELFGAEAGGTVRSCIRRPPVTIEASATLRQAADFMASERVGRLLVLERGRLAGIFARSDLQKLHHRRAIG